jgi:hypothetical protein
MKLAVGTGILRPGRRRYAHWHRLQTGRRLFLAVRRMGLPHIPDARFPEPRLKVTFSLRDAIACPMPSADAATFHPVHQSFRQGFKTKLPARRFALKLARAASG